jgi:RNA polymerase sigma factor (sigma-70 family)
LSQTDVKDLTAPDLSVFEMMSESELRQILHRMLGKLKTRERKAIELWMHGMSNRAIANELRTTVGAVKMLEFRTVLKLREMLKSYCRED